ncbi:hypothetical protein BDK51DRAFT_36801 [Blyttiomyces helicus]|uniref:F-box domain-containing protein n=1 Tax=Blyttiomyces helicus TaxID=388810 RepID=A0A4P9WG31_9FUNG|nr:hypothetical protein BDK51DRAFT_36801 [Blyttiomyces helicus]|eukprot:RKO91292.1 hypothetical protein BDK51DRAFT_36801 [Blyttiomyces helicus]
MSFAPSRRAPLNFDVLLLIFRQSTEWSDREKRACLTSAARVCRIWHAAAAEVLWDDVKLTDAFNSANLQSFSFGQSREEIKSFAAASKRAAIAARTRTLTLARIGTATFADIGAIKTPNLRSITLLLERSAGPISLDVIAVLFEKTPLLVAFAFAGGMRYPSPRPFSADIAGGFWKSAHGRAVDAAIARLNKLAICVTGETAEARAIESRIIQTAAGKLKDLTAKGDLAGVLTRAHGLCSLAVRGRTAELPLLTAKLPALRSASFVDAGYSGYNPFLVANVKSILSIAPSLSSFTLSFCTIPSAPLFTALAQHQPLNYLSLANTIGLDADHLATYLVARGVKLRTLMVDHCRWVGEPLLRELPALAPALTTLALGANDARGPFISLHVVDALLCKHPALERVWVADAALARALGTRRKPIVGNLERERRFDAVGDVGLGRVPYL